MAGCPSWVQATLRGGLMRLMNSECATCANGIDLAHAQESIPILARTLRSNCRQVKYIMDTQGLKASYEDMWKLTLVSVSQRVRDAWQLRWIILSYNEMPVRLEKYFAFLGCPGAKLVCE